MADTVTTDPAKLAELLEQIDAMKQKFASLRQAENDRPKRGRCAEDLNELLMSDFPMIELSKAKYTNKKGVVNVASMRSQFKTLAKDRELTFTPSVVEYDGSIFLVNFDADNAEEKFNNYILRKAGIDEKELATLTRDLDTATR
jgi:hypothetical protein